MLRPLLAFGALALSAFLLAPTVMSVHEGVEELDIRRTMPWELWKWGQFNEPPPTMLPPQCGNTRIETYSEVTDWPERIRKNEMYSLGGIVTVPSEGNRGHVGVRVDLFLNETKELPGEFLGSAFTDASGNFRLEGTFPTDLQATKYHLVAHAYEKREGCKFYQEHWSDPEMEVTSQTHVVWDMPPVSVIGRETLIRGRLVDDVGGPVREAEVDLRVGDEYVHVTTDADGFFQHAYKPTRGGNITVSADFDATEYYDGTRSETKLQVVDEHVEIHGMTDRGVEIIRNESAALRGRVYLSDEKQVGELRVELDGVKAIPCDGCKPTASFTVQPDDGGNFTIPVTIPSAEDVGPFAIRVSGGGLKEAADFDGVLLARVAVALEAESTGFFDRSYRAQARAVDDAGKPAPGGVVVEGPDGWHAGPVDATGLLAYTADAECGAQPVRAHYNGTGYHLPALANSEVQVCPYMAFIPPFLLDMPWWGWLLLAVAVIGGYLLYGHLRHRYASTITRGPPLALAFHEPRDAAAGIVGVGEAATLLAQLEEPLPDGHRLRMGTYRDMQDAEVGPDLRATFTVIPDKLGDLAIRAEILDKRGRVVTRRTQTLRVVHYAQEIERRHLALRRETLGAGDAPVTPREFQAWLVERAPDMEPEVAQRLIGIFEEADYGPRDVRRAELVAYLEAENALPEVTQRAMA